MHGLPDLGVLGCGNKVCQAGILIGPVFVAGCLRSFFDQFEKNGFSLLRSDFYEASEGVVSVWLFRDCLIIC